MGAQIIYLILVGFSLAVSFVKHGEPKKGNYNFWVDLISTLLHAALLSWGGFFDVWMK